LIRVSKIIEEYMQARWYVDETDPIERGIRAQ
jgi:hypothetical protein